MAHLTGSAPFADLRSFMTHLERCGQLVRVEAPVDARLEVTEIGRRLLAERGPAVLFTRVKGSTVPMLTNLFGTEERVAMAIGRSLDELAELGGWLAELRQPQPPQGMGGWWPLLRRLAKVRHMPPRMVRRPPCQEVVLGGPEVDLSLLPIQTCWPEDAGPLVTWPLVITRSADGGVVNLGVYRMQVIGRNRLIMRWLPHRGGAQHALGYARLMPVAVAIGGDPATLLAAVTPVPETLSEYAFAGLLRERRVEVAQGIGVPLPVPATAEMVLEGEINLVDQALEGPFGDHTGYYNEEERFPVMTVHRLTMRRQPIYLSTFTGRPPDEPAILALALNRVFVPLLQKQYPEIRSFHLPMEGCSYRVAVIGLDKRYPGHAFRVMTGLWGFLRQFLYTKYVIVVDAEVEVTDWGAVMMAMASHVHAGRDLNVWTHTPIDYLDFASPWPGLGGKLGIDATTKVGVEQVASPPRPDPPASLACDWPVAIHKMMPVIRDIRLLPGGRGAVVQVAKKNPGEGRRVAERIWRQVPPGAGADHLWVIDEDIDPGSWGDFWWAVSTRADPGRDLVVQREEDRFVLDATTKLPGETGRVWGRPLSMDAGTVELVDRRWSEYGLEGDRGEGGAG